MTLPAAAQLDSVLGLAHVRGNAERAAFLAAMRELGRDGADFTAERLHELMHVVDHFQALVAKDQVEFLCQRLGGAQPERDFAVGVQRICLEAANGFQRFLRNRKAWAGARQRHDAIVRVTGLALDAIHCFVKWGCSHDEPGRATPWKQLHALYAFAEGDGHSQVPFVLHASHPGFRPTVQSLYLRTLMLELLDTGNLSRVQLEIADGWFAAWCGDYALEAEYSARDHLCGVDLAADSGLHPVRNGHHAETMRFVRADKLKEQIEEVRAGLRQGRLYAGYGAGAHFPIEEHLGLLAVIEKLHDAILAGRDDRLEERKAMEGREIDVVLGMERVLRKTRPEGPTGPALAEPAAFSMRMIDASPAGLSALASDPQFAAATVAAPIVDPEVERWRVHDLSAKGFGLLVDRAASEAVMLNGIIALRNHETGAWMVGTVVRKQPNRELGEVLVGVEVLAHRPIALAVRAGEGDAWLPALYLPDAEAHARHDAVLLRIADFRLGSGYTIRAGGAEYRVRLNRIVRKGPDWIKSRFEVESKR